MKTKVRVRHLIDNSWVCEIRSGSWFTSSWMGVSAVEYADDPTRCRFYYYDIGSELYYNECRLDYETAVQTQLKIVTMDGMEMED